MHLTHGLADFFNRVGMVFGFLSFWFAAPEFIGEQRLKSWEDAIAASLATFRRLPDSLQGAIVFTLIFVGPLYVLYFKYKIAGRIVNSAFLLPTIGAVIGYGVSRFVSRLDRIVGALAKDKKVRQRSLLMGAVLFTLAFVLQFLATFAASGAGTG